MPHRATVGRARRVDDRCIVTVLVLGGTGEGRAVAAALVSDGVDVISSLAGAVRAPKMPPGRVRIGGFGGAAGFRQIVADLGVRAVVDATHPFAAAITARTAAICAADGIPYLRLERPDWTPGPEDRWTFVDRPAQTAAHIAPGACVFLATGRQTLPQFAGLASCRVLVRVIDPPQAPLPFADGAWIVGRPPFTCADEMALFATHRIDWLVVKNAGGTLAAPKLAAARALGISVLMLRRPPPEPGARVATMAQAVDWVLAQRGRAG